MNNSQQYEVMYVGRLRVPQRRGSESFIDEAVERFKESESFKRKELLVNENESSEFRDRTGSNSSTCSLTLDPVPSIMNSSSSGTLTRPRSISSLTVCDEKKEEELESGGTLSKVTEEQKEGERFEGVESSRLESSRLESPHSNPPHSNPPHSNLPHSSPIHKALMNILDDPSSRISSSVLSLTVFNLVPMSRVTKWLVNSLPFQ